MLFKEITASCDEVKGLLKNISSYIPEATNKVLILSKELNDDIDSVISQLALLIRVLFDICREASSASNMILNENNEALNAKRLEDFTYQSCDKFYPKDDTGPYENLRYLYFLYIE